MKKLLALLLAAAMLLAMTTAFAEYWNCPSCGNQYNCSNFCPNCGMAKPEPQDDETWSCSDCGGLLTALFIRSFIFEFVRVDGASMNDTLTNGEVVFMGRLNGSTTYLNVPFIGGHADYTYCDCPTIVIGGNPARFDAVICHYPLRGDTNFVKRVIGLPGDTVELKNGYLTVNGEAYPEYYINDNYRSGSINNLRYSYYVPRKGDTITVENNTALLNGNPVDNNVLIYAVYDKVHRLSVQNGILYLEDPVASLSNARATHGQPQMKRASEGTEIVFAEDNLMVMGDRRNDSNDSRQSGCISRSMVVGHVNAVIWPLNSIRGIPSGSVTFPPVIEAQ